MKKLKIRPATYEPKVTDHINDIIKYIDILIKKGFAYINNGEVLFEIKKIKNYGKLSKQKVDELINTETNSNKKHPEDFSLWKLAKKNEPFWPSPWSNGRPGWHIECSVMANKYLGSTLDIHGGGLDLIFPHHENEIAQSEAYSGSKFANYWIHNGLVMINGKKMSKSLNNFVTIKDIIKNHHPDIIRFAVLSHSYNTHLDFSNKLLNDVSKRIYYFYKTLDSINFLVHNKNIPSKASDAMPNFILNILKNFKNAMNNNFNTAKVLADLSSTFSQINNFITEKEIGDTAKIFALNSFILQFKKITNVLQIFNENPANFIKKFKLQFIKKNNITLADIETMIKARNLAKAKKNYKIADKIRNDLLQKRISIQDSVNSTTWDIMLD